MCLDYLKDFPVKLNADGVGVGYKVFCVGSKGGLYGQIWARYKSRVRGRWYRASMDSVGVEAYPAGFHIFVSKAGAQAWWRDWGEVDTAVVKVMYREVLAKGEHSISTGYKAENFRCVVARHMMIPLEGLT
jgi:hypothetical protein